MEAIATSFLGLAVSADREQNRELTGDCACELEALGINPPEDPKDKLAFADELAQALAGLLLVTPPQGKEEVTGQPSSEGQNPVAAGISDASSSPAVVDMSAPVLAEPPSSEASPITPSDMQTAKPDLSTVADKSQSAEVSPQGTSEEIVLEKTVQSDKPDLVREAPASSFVPQTNIQAHEPRLATVTFERGSAVPIVGNSNGQLAEKMAPSEPLRTSTIAQEASAPSKIVPSGFAGLAQLDSRWLAVKALQQEHSVAKDKVEAPAAATPASSFDTSHAIAERTPSHIVAPSTPAEQIAKSILTKADFIQSGGSADFQLRLDPPDLGPVRIVLTSTDDTVHLRLIVHEAAARQQLETQMDSLRQRLEDAGVSLGRFDVLQDRSSSSGNWQPPAWLNAAPTRTPIPAGRQAPYQASPATPTRIGLIDVMA